jgi:hypothetical protein
MFSVADERRVRVGLAHRNEFPSIHIDAEWITPSRCCAYPPEDLPSLRLWDYLAQVLVSITVVKRAKNLSGPVSVGTGYAKGRDWRGFPSHQMIGLGNQAAVVRHRPICGKRKAHNQRYQQYGPGGIS